MDKAKLTDNTARHRFELSLDGEVAAFPEYNQSRRAFLTM